MPTVFGSTPSISNGPIIRNQYSNSHHHGVPHSVSAGTELQSQHLMRPTEIELEEDEMWDLSHPKDLFCMDWSRQNFIFCQIYKRIWMKYFWKLKLCDLWFLSGCRFIFDTLSLDLQQIYYYRTGNTKLSNIYKQDKQCMIKIYLVILVNSTVKLMLYRIFFC